jgi:hypothetical protein
VILIYSIAIIFNKLLLWADQIHYHRGAQGFRAYSLLENTHVFLSGNSFPNRRTQAQG